MSSSDTPNWVFNNQIYSADDTSKAWGGIISAYEDIVHQNDGSNIHSGIVDNGNWKCLWVILVALPIQRHNLPSRVVGRCYLVTMTMLMTGIVMFSWNNKHLVVFLIIIIEKKKWDTSVKNLPLAPAHDGYLVARGSQIPHRRHGGHKILSTTNGALTGV